VVVFAWGAAGHPRGDHAPIVGNSVMAYPNGSFIPSINFDACIIEEQPEHLVVAVRIPKETILNNLSLFNSLALAAADDGSGDDDGPDDGEHQGKTDLAAA
jgi:hypothetical protein